MNRSAVSVLAAGCLWGLMGLFTRNLSALGFTPSGAVVIRCGVAAVFFALVLLIKDPKLFRVKLRDLWCFLGAGICSLLFFTYCYFCAIERMSLSAAAVLLYTAPAIVMVLSAVLFHERMTKRSVLALLMAFAGCVLVSGPGGTTSTAGILFGLGSGIGYALYSIFARFALLRGYDSRAITFYACLFCTLGAAAIWGVHEPLSGMFAAAENVLWCLGTGFVSCFLPYLLYTAGLTGLRTGTASVMASVEPVVATLLGIIVYREPMSLMNACGVLLVLCAILVLNLRSRGAER